MRLVFSWIAFPAIALVGCGSSDVASAPPPGDDSGVPGADSSNGVDGAGGKGDAPIGGDDSGGGSGDAAASADAVASPDAAAPADANTGNDGSADDGPGGDSPGTPSDAAVPGMPLHPWDWSGVVGTGQSLSVGTKGQVTLTTQPFHNLKLSLGTANVTSPPYNANDPALSLVPLVEPIRPVVTAYPGAYPLNIYGETPHTSMADQVSALFQRDTGGDYVTVHTVVGESGQPMSVIDKTAMVIANKGHAYPATLFEVAALKRLAAAAGKTYGVGAIVLTHGEADAKNANYEAAVYKLYSDYNADIAAITGQTQKVPLLLSQQDASPGDGTNPFSLLAQWQIGVDHPGEVVCVGPKYQYPYAPDHVHLIATGYERLGEKYAEVYYAKVVLGQDWQPLQPLSAHRSGNAITVTFHVPVPPLAWDTALPAPHQTAHMAWAKGQGFEVADSTGELAIASVALQGDAVVITLAAPPGGTNLMVRYAVTQDATVNSGGLAVGRIGQLRDSDPLVGYTTKAPQYNYAVSFAVPVN
jgi:hypothetical protein